MNDEQRALYLRLEAFALDDPAATIPFSARLALDNRWTGEFTRRAIREYKRFMFLTLVAGHTVVASEHVDQVWRLHLTYTRSYWNDFIPNTLGKALNRDPLPGGGGEQSRFRQLYADTLSSYKQVFDEAPPAEIWPGVDARFTEDTDRAWVNMRRNWVVSKTLVRNVLLLIAVLAAYLLWAAYAPLSMNPFRLRFNQSVLFDTGLLIVATTVAILIRQLLPPISKEERRFRPSLNLYELACLKGGPTLAADVAIARLVGNGNLTFDETSGYLMQAHLPTSSDALERFIFDHVGVQGGAGTKAIDIQRSAAVKAEPLKDRLAALSLLCSKREQRIRRNVPAILMALVTLYETVKILLAPRSERSVEHPAMLTLFAFIFTALFCISVVRSRLGDHVLRQYRSKMDSPIVVDEPGRNDWLAQLVAVRGVRVMKGTSLAPLMLALHPPPTDDDA